MVLVNGYRLADLVFEEVAYVLSLRGDLLAFEGDVRGFRFDFDAFAGRSNPAADAVSECPVPGNARAVKSFGWLR